MDGKELEVGASGSLSYVVKEADLASAVVLEPGETYPAVLSTTKTIALLELAAGRLLRPLLHPGDLSVGVVVEVKHIAATPSDATVIATARYTGRDGKLYTFEVVAEDAGGEIMRGVHKRAIISERRLLEGARARTRHSRMGRSV